MRRPSARGALLVLATLALTAPAVHAQERRAASTARPAPRPATRRAPAAPRASARPSPAATPAPGTASRPAPVDSAAPSPSVDTVAARPVALPGQLRAATRAELRTAPDGRVLGTVGGDAVVTPLARERGWVRVRVDGWVRERDLLPADSALRARVSALRARVSAADLRADPEGTRGTVVRWDVEVLAFQRADALRRDLQLGEPYLLARGPAGENALLYLALPAALVDEARAIAPLTMARITARVRTGRSSPTNVPILDIETLGRP
ncbi:MAG: hypothetical protein MUF21_11490 [Gemmatimonadaceae bacterium]|nr:hypothetical protein [Gemmatimonadaceae bacterium]